jgi:RNA polymerase sigma factor (sigma-70 family)
VGRAEAAGFDEFFGTTYPLLVRVALAAGAGIHEAEEAAGETMTYLYLRWGEIDNPRAYARKAVVTAVKKMKRRDGQRVARTIAGGQATPATADSCPLTAWEDRQWVVQRLDALPPAQREVMACVIDGMDTTEIAAVLGKTAATVRKNLQWARERLRVELAKERGERGEQ